LGKILIANIGPTEYERHGSFPVAGEAGLDAPPASFAQALASRLSGYQVAALYYVPVSGAKETAGVIARSLSVGLELLPGFEKEAGLDWWGLSPEDSLVLDCSFSEAPPDVAVKLPFDAPMDALREKVGKALDAIAEKHKKETVVIVSHRALTAVMALHLLHMANKHYRQIAQEAGALNLFEVRGGMPSALFINDTCHLHGLI